MTIRPVHLLLIAALGALFALSFLAQSTVSAAPGTTPIVLPATQTPAPAIVLPNQPRPHYTFSVDFNYQNHTLAVIEDVDYVNVTGENLDDLLLIVPPNQRKDVFSINSITWADGSAIQAYRLRGGTLHIPLRKTLKPAQRVQFQIAYKITLPFSSKVFGYTYRQANLGDWYPFVPLYRQGKGWVIHQPGMVGEYLVYDVADFDVDIRLVGGEKRVTIAAPAPAQLHGGVFHYEHRAARNFAWSASTRYEIVWSRAGDVCILGYVFPEDVEAGKLAAAHARDALTLFSEMYSPYPHPLLTFVEADFQDGMEFDGIHFLDRVYFSEAVKNGNTSGLTTLTVHEVSHQWWGQRVGSDQALEPWLDENMAIYSEYIFYEKMYPYSKKWWWGYRVESFKPSGWVNSEIYNFTDYRAYVNAVYLRGALFIDGLRKTMGDEAFFAFLKEYERRWRYRHATGEDFFNLLQEMHPLDLAPLLKEYFHQ